MVQLSVSFLWGPKRFQLQTFPSSVKATMCRSYFEAARDTNPDVELKLNFTSPFILYSVVMLEGSVD